MKYTTKLKYVLVTILCISACSLANEHDAQPTIERGAMVFKERCAICHGQYGLGEGLLALKIKDYPNTNLMSETKASAREDVHAVVSLGLQKTGISEFMPPMGDDLTWTELESVVNFVMQMRSQPEKTRALITKTVSINEASLREGMTIFDTRCALCHGTTGEGDGRMAKIIKTPPPFDLTASRTSDEYLSQIIAKGGQGVGRSNQMPPWGDQLTKNQIISVIRYVKTLRD